MNALVSGWFRLSVFHERLSFEIYTAKQAETKRTHSTKEKSNSMHLDVEEKCIWKLEEEKNGILLLEKLNCTRSMDERNNLFAF